jgi:lipopolysaccharide/colanic/teichoic acid biosynthesis glycosyltransferase
VKPGITGLAAITGFRGGTENLNLMQKRIDHDIQYIENWSIWLDIKISIITFWQMLTLRTGAH